MPAIEYTIYEHSAVFHSVHLLVAIIATDKKKTYRFFCFLIQDTSENIAINITKRRKQFYKKKK